MIEEIRVLLSEVLGLGKRGENLVASSALLGEMPEMDSMAVVTIITAVEEQYGVQFEDDDITAESFETLGSLCSLIEQKLKG